MMKTVGGLVVADRGVEAPFKGDLVTRNEQRT